MIAIHLALAITDKAITEEVAPVLAGTPCQIILELSEVVTAEEWINQFSSATPHVLLFDMGLRTKVPVESLIRQLRAALPSLTIVALARSAEPQTILDAMRAGASEFLFLPFREQLQKVLEHASDAWQKQEATRGKQGKVVGCLSAKGGSGATTIAAHLAADLPRQTKDQTLLLDLDLQAALVSFLVKSNSPYTVLDAAANVHRLDANYWKRLISNGIPGLHVLSAPAPLTSQVPLRREDLAHVMRFVRSQYSYAVADLGRSLTPLSLSAIESITDLLLVTTPEVPSLHLAKHILLKLRAAGLSSDVVRVVVNRMPKNPDITLSELETILGTTIYSVLPDDYAVLNSSYSEGKLLDPGSALGRGIASLTRKLAGLQRPAPQKEKKFKLFG